MRKWFRSFLRRRSLSEAVSGTLKNSERVKILNEYENGSINVLCACDLLNEGWDSPRTEVLFMARPPCPKRLIFSNLAVACVNVRAKEYLVVFDFIDNAGLFQHSILHPQVAEYQGIPTGADGTGSKESDGVG